MSSKSERTRVASVVACRGAVFAVAFSSLQIAFSGLVSAQTAPTPASSELPPLVVEPTVKKQPSKKKSASKKQAAPAVQVTAPQPQAADLADAGPPQDRNDPGTNGFVATQVGVATKTPGTVLTTPRSISTITKSAIEERNSESVYEALQYAAGVNAFPFSGGFITREQAQIRGFLAYQFLDGLKQHDSNWAIEPYGLERIDVLKGPASMLYGQGSPGGLVDMTSKRPTSDPFAEVVLKAGTHDKLQAGFDFGGPVGSNGVLTYRLTGMGRIADGMVDYTENDRFYIAPALTFRPNSDTSFTLLASYQYDPNLTVQQPLPYVGTVVPGANGEYISRKLFLGEPGYHDTDKESLKIAYELRHRFNDVWSFEQNAGYRHIDISLYELQGRGQYVGTAEVREMFRADYVIDTYQADTRLRAEFETGSIRHNVIFGFDYSNIPNYQGVGLNRASQFLLDLYNPVYGQPLPDNPLIQKRYQKFEQKGLYALDTLSVGDLTVVAGIRHDWADSAQQTKALIPATGEFSNPPFVPKEDEATTVQLAASYQLPFGIVPYVSYSESFFPTAGSNLLGVPFVPTTGEQYEAGIKYRPIGMNALFTAAVFELTQQNVLAPDPTIPGNRIQIGEVKTSGFEFEAQASLQNGWNLSGAYTYLDDGDALPYTATHQAAAWASYTFEHALLRGLTLGGGLRYRGRTLQDQVPAFTLFDAAARYDLGALSRDYENWQVSLNAKNLTDEHYVTNCESFASCYYGAGRTVDVTLRMRY